MTTEATLLPVSPLRATPSPFLFALSLSIGSFVPTFYEYIFPFHIEGNGCAVRLLTLQWRRARNEQKRVFYTSQSAPAESCNFQRPYLVHSIFSRKNLGDNAADQMGRLFSCCSFLPPNHPVFMTSLQQSLLLLFSTRPRRFA